MKNAYLWLISMLSLFGHMSFIRYLKDQRGETAPDDEPVEEENELDNVSLNLDGEDDDIVPEAEEEEEPEDEEEIEEEKPEVDEETQALLAKKDEQIQNLNRGIHQIRQELKALKSGKKDDGESPLTEAQVLALYREHKDDPDTLFNLVKYQIEQGSKKAKDEAVDIAEVSRLQKEIDTELSAQFPDLHNEDSDLRRGVDDTKNKLKIADHPFSDLLAIGAMAYKDMPDLLKAEYEKGKAEAARKKKIKENDLGDGNKKPLKKTGGKLDANFSDIARKIGLSEAGKKTYANLLGKKGSVEV
jgi:hypothetical protein